MLAMQLRSSNEATIDNLKFEQQNTAIFSFLVDKLVDLNRVYSASIGNKLILMVNSSTHSNKFGGNKAEKTLAVFKNKVQDLIIDFDEKFDYFEFLSDIRDTEVYSDFLALAKKNLDLNVGNAISIFLSQKDYQNISADEENYIFSMLNSNESQLQEFALAAILNWDNFSNVNLLKTLEMQNKYLQEDLEDFINSKA